jgi:hypothetical protein
MARTRIVTAGTLGNAALSGARQVPSSMVWDAYRRTTYRILAGGEVIDIRIGSAAAALDELLDEHSVTTWAFVTAWNPQSRPLPAADNETRQQLLVSEIARRGWKALPGLGIGDDERWPPEESVLILGISRTDAVALARRFDQAAIVFGRRHGTAELVAVSTAESQPE